MKIMGLQTEVDYGPKLNKRSHEADADDADDQSVNLYALYRMLRCIDLTSSSTRPFTICS